MSDLVLVRPIDGSGEPTYIGREALEAWSDIWEEVPSTSPAPVGEETKAVSAAKSAPTGKDKE